LAQAVLDQAISSRAFESNAQRVQFRSRAMRFTGIVVRPFLLAGVAVSDPGLRGSPLGTLVGEVQSETQNETSGAIASESPQDEAAEEIGEVHVEALAVWGWHTWTIVAETSDSGWAWDVQRVKFLTPSGEELSPTTPGCHAVESGHVDVPGYGPENAFVDGGSWWGGRKDLASGKFYLGIGCSGDRQVASVQIQQNSGSHFVEYVQVFHDNHLLKYVRVVGGSLQRVWEGPHPEPVFTMLEERHFPVLGNCLMRAEGSNSNLPMDNSHYTIEAWVMPDGNVGSGGLVSYGDQTTGRYQAFRFNGASGFRAYWWGRDLDATGLPNLADGQWHHVATTWDGQTRRILVDFVEVARKDMTGFNVVKTDNFCVGSSNFGREPFRGRMQGLKIWRFARSGNQMSSETPPAPCRPGEDIIAGTFLHFGHDGSSTSDQDCNERCQNTQGCTAWVRGRAPGGDPMGNAMCWLTRQVTPVWEGDGARVAGVPGCVNRPVKTCGGSGSGAACAFPFDYQGVTYNECTKANHQQLWCSLDPVYSSFRSKWGNCEC